MAEYELREVSPLEILLDPNNPRLEPEERGLSQEGIREVLCRRFKLDDLGQSIVASGFTDIDPIIAYPEGDNLVVREGNRRVGALQLLLNPELAPPSRRTKWRELAHELAPETKKAVQRIVVRVYENPESAEIDSYIGFRHVSGVLEWPAAEKARFIVDMVDRNVWSYEEIAKRIGSYPKHVERHYIASSLISQAKALGVPGAERIQIGVLLRALQAGGVADYLGIAYPGDPAESRSPIPEGKRDELDFFVWATFGSDEHEPILPESRMLTKWGQILQSEDAVAYLKNAAHPSFERAWFRSGGEVASLTESIEAAADNLEDSIPLVPDHLEDEEVIEAVTRCARRLRQILRDFPEILEEFCSARPSDR
jgi:hypothetical protein